MCGSMQAAFLANLASKEPVTLLYELSNLNIRCVVVDFLEG